MSTRYFRAGVGTVIYNQKSEIAIFKRAQPPVGIWQLQQGGIDLGEHPNVTLWRELQEETGLTINDIEKITEMPTWTVYEDVHSTTDSSIARVGQVHRWFFLKLKEKVAIDLSFAIDDEFNDWRWVTFDEVIARTKEHKKHVYQTLKEFFSNSIAH